ncbi:32577_t:CDS:2, partial [Gigaspora margarita]
MSVIIITNQSTNANISNKNEDSEETIVYFTSNLAVNANNIYYSTVSVEYPSTSPQNSKGPS